MYKMIVIAKYKIYSQIRYITVQRKEKQMYCDRIQQFWGYGASSMQKNKNIKIIKKQRTPSGSNNKWRNAMVCDILFSGEIRNKIIRNSCMLLLNVYLIALLHVVFVFIYRLFCLFILFSCLYFHYLICLI